MSIFSNGVTLRTCRDLVESGVQTQAFADDSHQDVNRDGDPDLGLHGVLAGTEERLDPKVLLNPFEEEFYLPAALIDLVPPDDALPDRTLKESGQDAARPPPPHPQLLQGQKTVFKRRCRGAEQQGQSHYEKIVRLHCCPKQCQQGRHVWQTWALGHWN